ncbi:MAG: 16S rRNA (cytosine(1402)-N(4))-methyltransferase RsmH [Planctomycetes bacterium]|nr:16S rRNA (cytosine(1402)-N(4))-methyltransferase RsmH [Planctomycetota bacterium]
MLCLWRALGGATAGLGAGWVAGGVGWGRVGGRGGTSRARGARGVSARAPCSASCVAGTYAGGVSSLVHIPVMPREIERLLDLQPGQTYADCTAGRGGHASIIGSRVQPGGTVILNDADEGNLAAASEHVRVSCPGVRVHAVHGNFAILPRTMEGSGLAADGMLADFGFSSTQIEDASRGFSFMRDGPLDMRFDTSRGIPASELVNTAPERELARWLREYGEEPAAGRIAQAIVQARRASPIQTTAQLAEVVRATVGRRPGSTVDPATKSFQALRIVVNDEIGSVEALLFQVARAARALSGKPAGGGAGGASGVGSGGLWLAKGARIAVLTFHSLEDRPVKTLFADICQQGLATDLARGGITASEEEIRANPRARSARLRAIRLNA